MIATLRRMEGRRLSRVRRLGALLASTCLCVNAAHAVDGTWTGATDGEWTTGTNWTSDPSVPDETATFTGVAGTTAVVNTGVVTIGTVVFDAAALAYTFGIGEIFLVNGATVGSGVVNNSANIQAFTNGSTLIFQNASSANAGAGAVTYDNNAFIYFQNSATAGNATIVNDAIVQFFDTSSAGAAQITNNAVVDFFDSSRGGTATITNTGTGVLTFSGTSSAEAATIDNSGTVNFTGSSSAGSGVVTTNNGATTNFIGNAGGGTAQFIVAAGGQFDISQLTATSTTVGSLEGGGTVLLGAKTLAVGANNLTRTFTGAIQDGGAGGGSGGGLTKIGAGTWFLDGVNTYTGATTVSAGTLSSHVANSLAAASAFQVASGATLDLNGLDQTIGSLADAGGAGGTVTSSVAGAVTLTAGGDNSSTSFSGTIGNGAGLVALTKTGGGTMTLSGANSYGGGTTVAAGALAAASNTAFGTGTVLIDGGTLQAAAAGLTLANAIAVNAGAIDTGANTLTLTGILADGGAPTSLTKLGTGTLVLSNINSLTAPTAIDAGTLSVTGSLAGSAIAVNSGGTLAGTGTVGVTTVNSGGTLAPGNPLGTLTVAGSLTFNAGSNYLVTLSPTTASQTLATGTASLSGATVRTAFVPGSYIQRSYTILSSAGLAGTSFAGLDTSNLPPGFTASLSYTPTDALLDLTAAVGASTPGGLNRNQQNVATALNGYFNAGGAMPPEFAAVFGLTGDALGNALTQLGGQSATGLQQAGLDTMSTFLGMMLDPFADGRGPGSGGTTAFAAEPAPPEAAMAFAPVLKAAPAPAQAQRWRAWGGGYGGYGKADGDAGVGSVDTTARTFGFAGGIDYRVDPSLAIGFALAGGGTNWGLANGLGGGRSDVIQAGIFAKKSVGNWYGSLAAAYGVHDASTERTVAIAGLTGSYAADFLARSYGVRAETGYRLAVSSVGVTPYAAVQAQAVRTPDYGERTSAGTPAYALSFAQETTPATRSELGAWFDRRALVGRGRPLTVYGRAAWAHDFDTERRIGATFQTLPGASFTVDGAAPSSDLALLSAGARLAIGDGWSVAGQFDGVFGSSSQTYAATGKLRKVW